MNNNTVLSVHNISKSYISGNKVKTKVISDLSVNFQKGEFVAVMGPSGVGKSTLLHLLGSLDTPDSGEIILNIEGKDYEYSKMSSDKLSEIRNRNIGFVFQFHHLLPEFSALENVMMPALISGKNYIETKNKARDLLKLVDVSHIANNRPTELSGGEQQRIAIARAVINNPLIIFADEPTGNLDSKNSEGILTLLSHLQNEFGATLIIATHSDGVAAISNRIIRIERSQSD